MNKKKRFIKNTKPTLVKVIAEKRTKKFLVWKIIGGISLVLGLLVSLLNLWDWFFPHKISPVQQKSAKEKFIDEKLDTGTLKLPTGNRGYSFLETVPIFNTQSITDSLPRIKGIFLKNFDGKTPLMTMMMGNKAVIMLKEDLYRGIRFNIPVDNKCYSSSISCIVKDNRLYVSTEFSDLQNEQIIGIIEYNHWQLYRDNTLDFNNDDERLEVRDKRNKIVFSLKYEYGFVGIKDAPVVYVNGYFLGPNSVSVLCVSAKTDTCISKTAYQWKEKAQELISNIKSIFP